MLTTFSIMFKESRGQQFINLFACGGDLFTIGVDIKVICHEEAAVATDGLDGLGIDAGLIEQAQVAVPEDMGCRAMKVEVFLNIAEQPDVDHLCDGLVPADNETLSLKWSEQLFQLGIQGDDAHAVLRLGGRENGLI